MRGREESLDEVTSLLRRITGERGHVAMLDAEALRSVGLPADAVDDTGTLLPQLAQRAIRAAIGGTVRADADSLPSYIDLWDRILCSTPQSGSGWANAVASFGAAMQARFDRTGVPDELAVAVEAHRVALGATSADQAGRATCWLNLGRALHTRFGLSALGSDLDEAIHATESAIAAAERGGPVRTIALQNLNTMSRDRYQNTGDIADLDRAVDVGFSALNAVSLVILTGRRIYRTWASVCAPGMRTPGPQAIWTRPSRRSARPWARRARPPS